MSLAHSPYVVAPSLRAGKFRSALIGSEVPFYRYRGTTGTGAGTGTGTGTGH